jgi:60 kDa SS-A/Ro ribonucleoprotein
MSSLNKSRTSVRHTGSTTHEGGAAINESALHQLIRSTMACMLWEDNFYEDGATIASRIARLVHMVTLEEAAQVAIEARDRMHLRHVPLFICRYMANHPHRGQGSQNAPRFISSTLAHVIQRPDELTEFMAIYWKYGKEPLSKQVKLGLAKAFQKFNEYSLAKYNRDKSVKLRDVLFLCHSKPEDVPDDARNWDKQERRAYATAEAHKSKYHMRVVRPNGFTDGELLYGKLIYDQLKTPDTWEVQLSAGADKRTTFERLMAEKQLGDLAFLRNLRNMTEAGVPLLTIVNYGDSRQWGRVLPFRFIAAARIVPQLEPHLERWMFKCLEGSPKLPGRTVLLVDTSGSMQNRLSVKSDLSRTDAAQALAMLLREVCDDVVVACFDSEIRTVPPRRGFALGELVKCRNASTDIGGAVKWANMHPYDRLIVLTDEQSASPVGGPRGKGYMINVAAHQNGVGFGPWLRVSGFSEAIVDYIQKYEEFQGS